MVRQKRVQFSQSYRLAQDREFGVGGQQLIVLSSGAREQDHRHLGPKVPHPLRELATVHRLHVSPRDHQAHVHPSLPYRSDGIRRRMS